MTAAGRRCCLAASKAKVQTPSLLATIGSVANAVAAPVAVEASTSTVDRELWLVDSEEAKARGFTEQDHKGSTVALMKNLAEHCVPHAHKGRTFIEELLSLDSSHLVVEVIIHICIHGLIEAIFHYAHLLAHRRSKAKAKARKEGEKAEGDSSSSSSSSSCAEGDHSHTVSK